jgi:predicted dehydrogenase
VSTSSREIGIGLIGAGWMGTVHSTSYRRVPVHFPEHDSLARLVIAADDSEQRARWAAETLGYEHWTTNWREVIEHPEVEAVSICTPNFLHREMAVAAANGGKHFWGEKPLGSTPEETALIADAVAQAGVVTMIGLSYRQAPAVRHAKALLDSDALGDINHFRTQFLASYAASANVALSWRFSHRFAGAGIIADLGSHAIDLAHFLLGPIVRVSATSAIVIPRRPYVPMGTGTHFSAVEGPTELGDVDNEDWAAALIEFESGLKGMLEASRVTVGADARYAFEVSGTRGAAAWNFERMNELELYSLGGSGDGGMTRVRMGPQHPDFRRFQPGPGIAMGFDDLKVIEASLFLESVADGEQREPGVREMLLAAKVADAISRSCRSGTWEEVRTRPMSSIRSTNAVLDSPPRVP